MRVEDTSTQELSIAQSTFTRPGPALRTEPYDYFHGYSVPFQPQSRLFGTYLLSEKPAVLFDSYQNQHPVENVPAD